MTASNTTEAYIPARWRWPVRILWFALAILLFSLYFAGYGPIYRALTEICQVEPCRMLTITPQELAILESYGLSLMGYVIYYLVLEFILVLLFSAMAFVVFWRRSATWLGVIVSQAFLFTGLMFFAGEAGFLARANPELLPFVDFLTSVSVVLVLMLFYLFPDGRFSPRWMRWFAAALIAAVIVAPFANPAGGVRTTSASMFVILAFAAGAPMGMVSQIYRYRKVSNPTQRQQTKWVLYGFLAMFTGMLPWMIFAEIALIAPGPGRLLFYLSMIVQYTLVSLFPVSVAIAILRYRLWEIDLVIRSTLQYGLLTGVLALAYFGGVVVIQAILSPLTGTTNSPLVTVITTLGIAALFNPMRGRVQDFIDRRFYRRKYDAELALNRFAETARDVVDMQALSGALLEVVDETMQPEAVMLWLKDG